MVVQSYRCGNSVRYAELLLKLTVLKVCVTFDLSIHLQLCLMEDVNEAESGGNQLVCTRKEIFIMIKNDWKSNLDTQLRVLEEQLAEKTKMSFKIHPDTINELKKLLCNLKSRWKASSRKTERFFQQNEKWLNSSVTVTNASTTESSTASATIGRPSKEFASSSDRTKRRRTEELRAAYSTAELAFATEMSLRSSGALQAAKVVKDVTTKSPTRASKYLSALKLSATPRATEVSSDEALALIIGSKLSKGAYQNIRNLQKKVGVTFLPSYEKVLQAKVRCYPSDITITETRAEVKLQALLDHISARLLQVQHDVIKQLSPQIVSKLRFILKWGCDGSSGQSEYKQKFSDADSSDANVFLTSVVPLQLIATDTQLNNEIIIWKNPRPSSSRYCRPIRLQFLQENVESTRAEEEYIEAQIASLISFNTVADGKEIAVNYELVFSMVDRKEGFSRKCSGEKTMEDVFHRLLVSSDPLITSLSNMQPKQEKNLSSEALQLLLPPDNSANQCILDVTENCESASDNDSD